MTPTPDQFQALSLMATWLSTTDFKSKDLPPSHRFFLLKGYAGTGKSYSIMELVRSGQLKPSEICFTAPTNKAVKVLRNYLDNAALETCSTKTIYSLLGLSLQANGEVKEITKPEEPVDLSMFKLIVVDEASMVNRFLFSAIEDAFHGWKVPFLFMGDPAQLPPVGEISSPVFKLDHGFTLTKVLRYGNSMLDLATSIRNVVDHPFPSLKIESAPPVFRVSKPQWYEAITENLELFRSGDAKVIAWRNITVDKYNDLIRQQLFDRQEARSNTWLPGDKIVAKEPCKDLDGETILHTAEGATVERVSIGTHPRHSEFEIYHLLCKHEDGKKITLRVLTSTGSFAVNNRLNELSAEAKGGKRYKWREFWALKESFHVVKHDYAQTSHGSQGSSYLKTFVDLEDLMLNRNRQEAFRSLYVSCTRQRDELWIS